MPVSPFALAPEVIQAIIGIGQGIASRKMLKNLEDPVYEIPDAAKQALGVARTNAGSFQMPGQAQLEQGQNQIFSNSISGISDVATSAPEALAAMIQAGATRSGAQNQIGFQAANYYDDAQKNLEGALGTYAGYEDKAFDINVMQPFERKAAAASALGGGALGNIYSAANNASGVLANNSESKRLEELLNPKSATTAAAAASNNFNDNYELSAENKAFMESLDPETINAIFQAIQSSH